MGLWGVTNAVAVDAAPITALTASNENLMMIMLILLLLITLSRCTATTRFSSQMKVCICLGTVAHFHRHEKQGKSDLLNAKKSRYDTRNLKFNGNALDVT